MCSGSEDKQHHIDKLISDFLSTFDANKPKLRIMLGYDAIHLVLYELLSESCSIGRRTGCMRKIRCVLSCDINFISTSHLAYNNWLNYMESFGVLVTSESTSNLPIGERLQQILLLKSFHEWRQEFWWASHANKMSISRLLEKCIEVQVEEVPPGPLNI